MREDSPVDPFAGDPADPVHELRALDPEDDIAHPPLTPQERETVVEDLADLEVFFALLEPRGIRGLVVDCGDCQEEHFFGWDLLRGNLAHLLEFGVARMHEPAFDPDPAHYVSWDYARGYVDGTSAADEAYEPATD